MKKTILFILVALFATSSLFADDISVQQALQIASQFAMNEPSAQSKMRKAQATSPAPTLAYAVKSDLSDKDNVYVINYGNDMGFVVVSGESGTGDEILGYCDHGAFEYDDCPPQMKEVLDFYSLSIDTLRKHPELAAKRRLAQSRSSSIGNVIVEPLLTTQWSQWAPYNNLCPTGCPTGCVPTAVAQIMKYWRWPDVTREKVSGEDFSGHVYDWDNMIDNYETTSYTAEQADAVAHLMADIGKALGTNYGPEGSGTGTDFLPLVYNFKYNRGAAYHENLTEVMKAELNQSRPLLYSARPVDYGNGHELVVDGYTSNNYFHFNYGWGGSYDGFYKYAPLYNVAPSIITGIYPEDTDIIKLNDIKYMLYKNGTATIIGYFPEGINEDDDIMTLVKRENGAIVIPSNIEHNGRTYKVTRICQRAFYNKGHFTKITLGDNIEAIDNFAFINSAIDELVLSDNIEVVPDKAFETIKIKKLTIGKNVKRIGKRAFYMGVLSEVTSRSPAFEADDEAFSMTNPDCGEWLGCITSVGYQTFAGASFSKSPIFSKVEKIGARAFNGVTFPEEVDGSVVVRQFHVKSKLKSIDPNAFYNTRLNTFKVDDSNPYFSTSNSSLFARCMLFNKNATSLVLTIDPSTSIGEENGYMTAFPETVVRLEPSSISTRSKTNYGSVTIPNTIIEMEGAFKDCEYVNKLTCLAVVPPEISDTTFNDKMFENSPRLYVPEGTEDLYRNAPGWRRFKNIVADQAYTPVPPQGRQYYMVVSSADEKKQQRVNIPVNEIKSMEVSEDGTQVVIKRNGKEDLTTSVTAVDSIAWMPGFVYENAEVFDINEDNLTVEAQKCKIRFDPTVIDGDVQLCVRNSVLKPNVMEGVVSGMVVDLSLSNDTHKLSGTVDITIPMTYDSEKQVGAAYYNEETGEWEPVYFKRNKETGEITIVTNHLSAYAIFEVANANTKNVMLNIFDEVPQLYILNEAIKKLLNIMSSDDPEVEMKWQYKSDMSLWQSAGLDVLYNAANGTLEAVLGYKPFAEEIDNAVTAMGYLGTAMNILDVARADLKGDDVGVAAGTLNTILSHATGQMASAIGTPIMSVSMAGVAAIGIALNKFGEKVAKSKLDFYRLAYGIYYSKEGDNLTGNKNFRTATDWYNYFYPAFEKGNMTENRLNAYIEQSVRNYCHQFWEDDNRIYCIAEAESRAKSLGISTWSWETESLRQQISDEYFSELMHGMLVSVFQAIRNDMKVEAYNRYASAAKSVAALVNRQIAVRIWDNSWKEGETSKYEGWTVRFSYIPSSLSDKDAWQVTLNKRGRGGINYFTEYALIVNDMPTRLTLVNPDGKEVADYPFTIANKKGKQIIDIDLSTGGVEVENPKLEGLELRYDPAKVDATYDWYGYFDGKYMRVGGLEMPIPLNNSFNKRANLQLAVEKLLNRHNFITVDASGNFKIGDDITGRFENNGLEGTAKFVIDTNNPFVEKTKEQFIKDFNKYNDKEDVSTLYNLLNGTIAHKIEGEVKITRESVKAKEYDVTYVGSGTFSFEAEVIDRIDNYQYEELFKQQNIKSDDFTTRKVEQEGQVTLKYTTKLQ